MNTAKKRTKWEPAALMALVLGLGLWVAFGPASKPSFPISPQGLTQEIRVGQTRGVLEAFPSTANPGEHAFRLWLKGGPNPPKVLTKAEAEGLVGQTIVQETIASSSNRVFRALNITSWTNLVWIGIGLIGQLAFSGRMVLQWITSEKSRKSVITESFWWFSLIGGVTLFSYFVFRQDPIGILGQASGVVIYARNIRLLRKQARRAAQSIRGPGASPGTDGNPHADE